MRRNENHKTTDSKHKLKSLSKFTRNENRLTTKNEQIELKIQITKYFLVK